MSALLSELTSLKVVLCHSEVFRIPVVYAHEEEFLVIFIQSSSFPDEGSDTKE